MAKKWLENICFMEKYFINYECNNREILSNGIKNGFNIILPTCQFH